MKVANENKTNGGLLKKILICCAVACVVIASVVSVVVIKSQGGTKEIKRGHVATNSIYYATPEEFEASGAASASPETKGGAIYVASGTTVRVGAGMVLEGYNTKDYGGAVYVEAGGTFILESGAVIQFCTAKLGGAICAADGANVEIQEGSKIICNTTPGDENGNGVGNAVYVVESPSTNFSCSNNAEISNNYDEAYTDYVAYYVDGVLKTAAPLAKTNSRFAVDGYAPVVDGTYDKCCGYFTDTDLSNNIEIGAVITSKITPVTRNGLNFYNVYTKRATVADNVNGPIRYDNSSSGQTVWQDKNNKPTGELVIPRTINGYDVKYVKAEGFASNNNITAIYLPSTIEDVRDKAFNDCTNVKYLALPKNGSLTTIGQRAFHGFYRNTQTSLVIPNSVQTIGKYAFYNWKSYNGTTMTLRLSNQLTIIESGVFGNAGVASVDFNGAQIVKIKNESFHYNKLTSISLPSTLLSIYDHAFNYNYLTSITIPKSVHDVGTGAFDYNGANGNTLAALYTMYNGGYYLGREDHGDGELYPTTQTVGGQYYNPYYFLVGFTSSSLNTEQSADDKGTFTCYKLNPYMKFMSTETIFVLRQKLGANVQLIQWITNYLSEDIPNSYSSTNSNGGYKIRYMTHVISSKEKTAGLYVEYVYDIRNSKTVFIPFIYDDFEWGCLRGVRSSVTTLVIPATFSRIGNFFTTENKQDKNNVYVPANLKTVRLTSGDVEIKAFYKSSITTVYFDDSTTNIPVSAFELSSITDVYFGKNVTTISGFAFVVGQQFNIHYGGSATDWAHITFASTWKNYADKEEYLKGWNLYLNGTKATNIILSTNTINAYAFENCNLSVVGVGNSVTSALSVGVEAFAFCRELTEFTYNYFTYAFDIEGGSIEAEVAFGDDCFWSCRSLVYFVIMRGASTGTTMLGDCTSLRFVYISNQMNSIPRNNWDNGIFAKCTGLKSTNQSDVRGVCVNYSTAAETETKWGTYWRDLSHYSTRGTTGNIDATVITSCPSVSHFLSKIQEYLD